MPRGLSGAITRNGISLPSLPAIVIVRARPDVTGAGNGPSPRRRASRNVAAPVIHHSGWPVSTRIICAFRLAVSGSIAASPNKAGSNGRVSVIIFLLRGPHYRARPGRGREGRSPYLGGKVAWRTVDG